MTKSDYDYEDLLKKSVEDKDLREQVAERMTAVLAEMLPEDHWHAKAIADMPPVIRDHLRWRWFRDFKSAQPQLPVKALAALAEVAAKNAHPKYDPPEGEDIFSIEPIGLEHTARFRQWDIMEGREPRTFTHIASFSNTGLQPHYYCRETGEWICL